MENNYLTLKNIYRLITVNDYPFYSAGMISEKNKKGLTLIKFWKNNLIYNWRNTEHGRQIWRTDGSRNRYHSELCNRKENFPFYDVYIREILSCLKEDNYLQQVMLFMSFLKERQYDHAVFMKKIEKFLQLAKEKDPWFSKEGYQYLMNHVERAKMNREVLSDSFWAAWILTAVSLHALAGNQMSQMKTFWEKKELEPENIWELLHKKREEPIFITWKDSELLSGQISAEHFFGREEEMYDLKEMLQKGGNYLISGIGGVGKTELLRQLLHWCIREKQADRIGVIQYEKNLKESLAHSFLSSSGSSVEDRFRQFRYLLSTETEKKTVLFIDNMDQRAEAAILSELAALPCTIFISSRLKVLEGFQKYEVHPPEKIASSLIFRDNHRDALSREERDCLDELLDNEVFRHPLTLRFLGKASHARSWSVRRLKQELDAQGVRISWQEGQGEATLQDLYRRMYHLFYLSGTQERLVRMFSVLPYTSIDKVFVSVFFQGFLKKGEEIFQELQELSKTGWLEETENGYRMHPVIRESIRVRAPVEKEFTAFWERAAKCYYEGQEPPEKDPKLCEWSRLIFFAASEMTGKVSNELLELAINAGKFLSNPRETDRVTMEKLQSLAKRCEEMTDEVKLTLGWFYLNCYGKEQGWEQEFWKEQERCQTVSDVCLNQFALVWTNIFFMEGNFEQGAELLKKIQKTSCRIEEKITVVKLQGMFLLRQIEVESAIDYFDKTILMAIQNERMDMPLLGETIYMKGQCHLNLGQIREAKECIAFLEQKEQTRNGKDDFSIFVKQLHGEIAWAAGEMEEAVLCMEEMKRLVNIFCERSSTNYALACVELGTAYNRVGRHREALENQLMALKIQMDIDPNSSGILNIMNNNIGVTYLDIGEPEKALFYLEKAYCLANTLGELSRAEPAWNLSRACRMLGKTDKEVSYLEEALPIFEKLCGPEYPKTKAAKKRMNELKQ